MCSALLEAGASADLQEAHGAQPLLLRANTHQQFKPFHTHLTTNLPRGAGFTALHFAVLNGFASVARALLAAGANPDLLTEAGETAYALAERLRRDAPPARVAVCRDVCEVLTAGGTQGAGAGGSTTPSATSKRPSSVSSQASGSAPWGQQQQAQQATPPPQLPRAGSSGPPSSGGAIGSSIRAIFGGRGLGRPSGMQRMVTDM